MITIFKPKKGIVLLEVIFASVIIGVLFFTSLQIAKTLATKNNFSYASNIAKLEFETLREFLTNKLQANSNTTNFDLYSHLQYDSANKALMYDGYLLLSNVESFSTIPSLANITYTICITPIKPIGYNGFNICQKQILIEN